MAAVEYTLVALVFVGRGGPDLNPLLTSAPIHVLKGAALLARRGHKSRTSAVLGGALVCAGELCLRWSVFKAGSQSARDPKYVVEPQRARVSRSE